MLVMIIARYIIILGVAAFGGEKNQFGMPSSDTSLTGPVFVAVGKNQTKKGEVIWYKVRF
jgi:hypothetical protein